MKEHSGKKAHIRPRVRSRVNKETTATATNDDIDELIDETQRQLDSLLRTVDVSQSTIPKLPGIQSQPQRVEEILLPKPTGILKAPKYTNPAPAKSDGEQLVPDVSAGGARAKLEPA